MKKVQRNRFKRNERTKEGFPEKILLEKIKEKG